MPAPCSATERQARAWAASGAMALSGPADSPPLGPPERLVDGIAALGGRITDASGALRASIALDWLALLGERAAVAGLRRAGTTSCGGGTRLLPTADGWLALSLARPSDVDLLPAWLSPGDEPGGPDGAGCRGRSRPRTGAGVAGEGGTATRPGADLWEQVGSLVAGRRGAELADGAALLGLPVGVLGEQRPDPGTGVLRSRLGASPPAPAPDQLTVLDLSALWAGPLCTSLLGSTGATVVKVESSTRPDGARAGPSAFFDLLNAGKRSVALDLRSAAGRAHLATLIERADVVVESSRPRALEQLGIVAADVLAAPTGPRVWASITGHGRASPRVSFGDDAAVAGGLVVRDEVGPCFCADAVADPASALAATAEILEALATGGRWLVDVAMAGVSASLAGPTLPAVGTAAPPRSRGPAGAARPLGADTAGVVGAG